MRKECNHAFINAEIKPRTSQVLSTWDVGLQVTWQNMSESTQPTFKVGMASLVSPMEKLVEGPKAFKLCLLPRAGCRKSVGEAGLRLGTLSLCFRLPVDHTYSLGHVDFRKSTIGRVWFGF